MKTTRETVRCVRRKRIQRYRGGTSAEAAKKFAARIMKKAHEPMEERD